jgi:hypothetical protein
MLKPFMEMGHRQPWGMASPEHDKRDSILTFPFSENVNAIAPQIDPPSRCWMETANMRSKNQMPDIAEPQQQRNADHDHTQPAADEPAARR